MSLKMSVCWTGNILLAVFLFNAVFYDIFFGFSYWHFPQITRHKLESSCFYLLLFIFLHFDSFFYFYVYLFVLKNILFKKKKLLPNVQTPCSAEKAN